MISRKRKAAPSHAGRKLYSQPRRIPRRGEPRALGFIGDSLPRLYVCDRCGCAHSPSHFLHRGSEATRHAAAREAAARCCDPRCRECGRKLKSRLGSVCDDCATITEDRDFKRWLKRLPVEPAEDGVPVFARGLGQEFFVSVAELREFCEHEGRSIPAYVQPCGAERAFQIDAVVLDRAFGNSESFPGAMADISPAGEDDLIEAIERFNAAQTVTIWEPQSIAWVLDEVAFRALCDVDERGLPDLHWTWEPPGSDAKHVVPGKGGGFGVSGGGVQAA